MKHYTLSLCQYYHDASIAVFEDDVLVFYIQSERISRVKHDRFFKKECFDYIYNNITKTFDIVVVNPFPSKDDSQYFDLINSINYVKNKFHCKKMSTADEINSIIDTIPHNQNTPKYSHHCTHALSAFYMSPFEEAVCLIVDGSGFGYSIDQTQGGKTFGITGAETTSILEIDNNYKRTYLYKRSICSPMYRVNNYPLVCFDDSGAGTLIREKFKSIPCKFDASTHLDIGMMYLAITRHIGFKTLEAGKTMGLSAYGKKNDSIPPFLIEGTQYSNKNVFNIGVELNSKLYPELFANLSFEKKADLAYAVQKSLEEIFLHHAEFIKNNSKIRNLVIGGGCALNILGVAAIKEKYPEFNIFVDPIAHDATHSIGLGIHIYNFHKMSGKLIKKNHFNSIYTGPKYDLEEMSLKIDEFITRNS